MAYVYKHFIPQNTAPKGAKSIGVYDGNGKKVCNIPLGKLVPPTETKLYSFGLLSDIHVYKKDENGENFSWVTWKPDKKLDDALSFFESQDCAFCAHCGDITQTGFYMKINESDANEVPYFEVDQMAVFKDVCDRHTIPVYGCCGNHESYYGMSITQNMSALKTYTGIEGLFYTVTYGNDAFIFISQPEGNTPMDDASFSSLRLYLEGNPNKRCFIFVHPHISSGNPVGAYKSNPLFQNWKHFSAFKELLSNYPKTILFHGHTHVKFECQKQDENGIYSNQDGFHSVHVPSSSTPRDVVSGALVNRTDESQGYIVDVYDDCIVLNGMDLINNTPVPLGVYKIDTTTT